MGICSRQVPQCKSCAICSYITESNCRGFNENVENVSKYHAYVQITYNTLQFQMQLHKMLSACDNIKICEGHQPNIVIKYEFLW